MLPPLPTLLHSKVPRSSSVTSVERGQLTVEMPSVTLGIEAKHPGRYEKRSLKAFDNNDASQQRARRNARAVEQIVAHRVVTRLLGGCSSASALSAVYVILPTSRQAGYSWRSALGK